MWIPCTWRIVLISVASSDDTNSRIKHNNDLLTKQQNNRSMNVLSWNAREAENKIISLYFVRVPIWKWKRRRKKHSYFTLLIRKFVVYIWTNLILGISLLVIVLQDGWLWVSLVVILETITYPIVFIFCFADINDSFVEVLFLYTSLHESEDFENGSVLDTAVYWISDRINCLWWIRSRINSSPKTLEIGKEMWIRCKCYLLFKKSLLSKTIGEKKFSPRFANISFKICENNIEMQLWALYPPMSAFHFLHSLYPITTTAQNLNGPLWGSLNVH